MEVRVSLSRLADLLDAAPLDRPFVVYDPVGNVPAPFMGAMGYAAFDSECPMEIRCRVKFPGGSREINVSSWRQLRSIRGTIFLSTLVYQGKYHHHAAMLYYGLTERECLLLFTHLGYSATPTTAMVAEAIRKYLNG
jgi:hypothetical protein